MMELSPLDGRYRRKTEALRAFFSEHALHRARLMVEIGYFIMLSEEKGIRELPKLNAAQKKALWQIVEKFTEKEALAVSKIEKKTNHDVKAVEYYLKEKMAKIKGLKKHLEFVHFGMTSEDVNNLAYGILINEALTSVIQPTLKSVIGDLSRMGKKWMSVEMLSLTHGQPATPSTVGHQMMVFVERLEHELLELKHFKMNGKFGGAVGNYSAHKAAYPEVKWEAFGKKFIKSLGLKPLTYTTQINPHDDIAELSHIMHHANTIIIDLSRDMWQYISRGVFQQKLVAGEVGSSTMPHKVNPIDFENAEGNLGLSNALFHHFADKLPISRLQRDLSDSTVQRNIGVAFGHHTLAMAALKKGLSKIALNKKVITQELRNHPEVLAEAIQTVMRKNCVEGAYEKMKKVTRGETVTIDDLKNFVEKLEIPKKDKDRLRLLFS